MRHVVVDDLIGKFIPEDAYPEAWDVPGLHEAASQAFNLDLPIATWAKEESIAHEEMHTRVLEAADAAYAERVAKNTPDVMRYVEKQVVLQTLDHLWREHLVVLDHLRQVVGWRGIAQRDPLNEYKSEAFELYEGLKTKLRETVTAQLARVEVQFEAPTQPELPPLRASHIDPLTGEDEVAIDDINARIDAGEFSASAAARVAAGGPARDPTNPRSWGRVGCNEACPCGSGKKYKHCHGVLA